MDKDIQIEIYTLEWCPYCRKTKSFFKSKNLSYTEYDIKKEAANKKEMLERTGGEKTVPQIFISGQHIGGYSDLIKMKTSGKLAELIDLPEGNFHEKMWDLTIIGAGPAGLNCALYAARKGLETLLLAVGMGGQVIETDLIDNWIGSPEVNGQELMQSFWEHTEKFSLRAELGEMVTDVTPKSDNLILTLDDARKISTRTAVIASGTKKRSLGVPGENEFKGKGVHYCAICDGFLYAGDDVAVVGGGNSGLEAALDLAKLDCNVSLIDIHTDLQGDIVLQEKIKDNEKITIYTSHEVKKIEGSDHVELLTIRETETGEFVEIPLEAVFVEIGLLPNSGFVCNSAELNDRDEIVINENNETTVKGLYAAGDVTNIKDKQIIVAAAEGAKAGLRVNEYLNS